MVTPGLATACIRLEADIDAIVQASSGQVVDEGVGGLGGAAVVFGKLSPDEDAGMEANEGEPGGLVGRKAEGAERGVSTAQVGHVGRSGQHVRNRAGDSPAPRRCARLARLGASRQPSCDPASAWLHPSGPSALCR